MHFFLPIPYAIANEKLLFYEIYEYFLANSCLNLSCELVSFLQIIYENAADTRICKRLFVDVVLYEILSL